MAQTYLRRLADLPGVDALEMKALMKPRFADPDMPEGLDEIDAVAREVFGLSLDEAEAVALPADWDGIERLSGLDAVEAFEAEGWDVGDKRRKPLRLLGLFALPLALAMRGVAGPCPSTPSRIRKRPTGAPTSPPRPAASPRAEDRLGSSPHRRGSGH